MLNLVSDSILITLCIFLGVCFKITDDMWFESWLNCNFVFLWPISTVWWNGYCKTFLNDNNYNFDQNKAQIVTVVSIQPQK